jgi:hypothetical protein
MCTVSVLLDAERNILSMLKAREQMLTHLGTGDRGSGLPPLRSQRASWRHIPGTVWLRSSSPPPPESPVSEVRRGTVALWHSL